MKKILLLVSALCLALGLTGCSWDTVMEYVDLDKIADLVLEASKTELEAAKTAEEIKAELPQELAAVTVDDAVLDSGVTHLAIVDRNTDNVRQTDWVKCEVIVEGEGIYARYICELSYTYTRNSGWSLVEWTLDTEGMNLQVTAGTLTQQFAQRSLETLSQEFGADAVSYQDSSWNAETMRCTELFTVNMSDGILTTQGTVSMTATLSLDTNQGLYYSWSERRDDSGLVRGADLAGTTWLVSGKANTDEAILAFRVESFSMEDQTLVVSAYSAYRPNGRWTEEDQLYSQTVSWTNGNNGVVTFTLAMNDRNWDLCFDSGSYWARIDGSYLDALYQCDNGADLETLVDQGVAGQTETLEYDSASTGNSWTASDGTVVYNIQIEYPEFSGDNAYLVNRAVNNVVNELLSNPGMDTDRDYLDEVEAASQEGSFSLPCYNKLDISVQYNRGGYISMLLTYTQRLASGQVTYRYDGLTYDLDAEAVVEQAQVLSGDRSTLSSLIMSYTQGEAIYTEATAMSYLQAWTLSRNGVVCYMTNNENSGTCTKVTIPYTESACILNPER